MITENPDQKNLKEKELESPFNLSLLGSLEHVHPSQLSWNKLDVWVQAGPNVKKGSKEYAASHMRRILNSVSGKALPGQLVGVIGASGSGKTTLLNVLTARNLNGLEVKGNISINGQPVSANEIKRKCAYVPQHDVFFGTLTVREHLYLQLPSSQCLLRIPKLQKAEHNLRVTQILTQFGLIDCQDTLIGIPGRIKCISGGEMKRLSLATELLLPISLLFCDEPTSGLDSFMAENIIQILKEQAKKNRCVIATIHQPSSEIFSLFDHILLLAEGRVAFMGESKAAEEFFNSIELRCPNNYNPADFYIRQLAIRPGAEDASRRRIKVISETYEASSYAKKYIYFDELDQSHHTKVVPPDARTSPYLNQVCVLIRRSFLVALRDPLITYLRMFEAIFVAVFLGIVYFQVDVDQKGIQNINGALFLIASQMTFQSLFAVLNTMTNDLIIFKQEYMNNLYQVDAYFFAKVIAEIPVFVVVPILFMTIEYFMIGLRSGFIYFAKATLIVLVSSDCALSIGYLISCISSTITIALTIGPIVMVPLMVFGGFFLNIETVPFFMYWIKYVSWFFYSTEALFINQWIGNDDIKCEYSQTNLTQHLNRPSLPCIDKGIQVIDKFSFDPESYWKNVGVMCFISLVLRFFAYLVLLVKARNFK